METAAVLVSALLGAVVGGVLSMVGSIFTSRYELRRAQRVQMHSQTNPKLRDQVRLPTKELRGGIGIVSEPFGTIWLEKSRARPLLDDLVSR
jgi:hypothetical protein